MTRFNISLKSSVDMVLWTLDNSLGGEIVVPKLKAYKLSDLAKAVDKNLKIKIIGIRQGEKIHEELISRADNLNAYDIGKYYLILNNEEKILKYYKEKYNAKKTPSNFFYTSETPNNFLSIDELKKVISKFQN